MGCISIRVAIRPAGLVAPLLHPLKETMNYKLIDEFNAEGIDRSQITRDWYAARIRRYLEFLAAEGTPLTVAGPAEVKRFLGSLREQNLSWSTRNGSHTALLVFYEWLVARGHVERNPFEAENIRRPRRPRRIKRDLSLASLQAVLDAAASDDSPMAIRDYALLILLADTGMRRMEVVGLNVGHINREKRTIAVLIAKGDNQRNGYLKAATIRAVERWLAIHPQGRKKTAPLFISLTGRSAGQRLSARRVNGILARWSREAGLEERLHPHDVRRMFATVFSSTGGGMNILQELMGHEDMETTMGYIMTGEDEKRRQHDRHSPLNFLNVDAGE